MKHHLNPEAQMRIQALAAVSVAIKKMSKELFQDGQLDHAERLAVFADVIYSSIKEILVEDDLEDTLKSS